MLATLPLAPADAGVPLAGLVANVSDAPGELHRGGAANGTGNIFEFANEGVISVFPEQRRVLVRADAVADAAVSHLWSRALLTCLAFQDCLSIHAALVECDGRGIVVLGESGAGKSTLVAAMIAAGARVVTDDLVVLDTRTEPSRGYALRKPLLFREPASGLLPEFAQRHLTKDVLTGRPLLAPDSCPECFLDSAALEEIWVLSADGHPQRTELRPSPSAAVLAALYRASSPALLPGIPGSAQALARLAQCAPGFEIMAGLDLLSDPAAALGSMPGRPTRRGVSRA